MEALSLLQELVALPGPPGQETRVREAVATHVQALKMPCETDAKGNLLVRLGLPKAVRIVVTAHLDEIGMIVRGIAPDGRVTVGPLGGIFPWKLGEGPVQILTTSGAVDAVFSFGSIHTADPRSTVRRADTEPVVWDMAFLHTGHSADELKRLGVRPGSRVVVHPSRRGLLQLGDSVAGHFLDDRADLVAWLLALQALRDEDVDVLFAATAAEEVGGEGALYLLQEHRPEVCIALELGPKVGDAPVALDANPTVWANDSYSAPQAADLDLVAALGERLGMRLQFQALSRGGSDASCAASRGLCARPFTLGLPMENSHGYEIMHKDAMAELARLTVALVRELGISEP